MRNICTRSIPTKNIRCTYKCTWNAGQRDNLMFLCRICVCFFFLTPFYRSLSLAHLLFVRIHFYRFIQCPATIMHSWVSIVRNEESQRIAWHWFVTTLVVFFYWYFKQTNLKLFFFFIVVRLSHFFFSFFTHISSVILFNSITEKI